MSGYECDHCGTTSVCGISCIHDECNVTLCDFCYKYYGSRCMKHCKSDESVVCTLCENVLFVDDNLYGTCEVCDNVVICDDCYSNPSKYCKCMYELLVQY